MLLLRHIYTLKLDWHREELRRARTILMEMDLISPSVDGRYVLGRLGPFANVPLIAAKTISQKACRYASLFQMNLSSRRQRPREKPA